MRSVKNNQNNQLPNLSISCKMIKTQIMISSPCNSSSSSRTTNCSIRNQNLKGMKMMRSRASNIHNKSQVRRFKIKTTKRITVKCRKVKNIFKRKMKIMRKTCIKMKKSRNRIIKVFKMLIWGSCQDKNRISFIINYYKHQTTKVRTHNQIGEIR